MLHPATADRRSVPRWTIVSPSILKRGGFEPHSRPFNVLIRLSNSMGRSIRRAPRVGCSWAHLSSVRPIDTKEMPYRALGQARIFFWRPICQKNGVVCSQPSSGIGDLIQQLGHCMTAVRHPSDCRIAGEFRGERDVTWLNATFGKFTEACIRFRSLVGRGSCKSAEPACRGTKAFALPRTQPSGHRDDRPTGGAELRMIGKRRALGNGQHHDGRNGFPAVLPALG